MIKRPYIHDLSTNGGHFIAEGACPPSPQQSPPTRRTTMMTKVALALALAIAAVSTVPAFAAPKHGTQVACTEDLGYGRTGSYGC